MIDATSFPGSFSFPSSLSLSLSRCVGRVGENPGNEVVLDGVANMDVGFEASDSGSKHPSSIYLSYFILQSKVGFKLFLI